MDAQTQPCPTGHARLVLALICLAHVALGIVYSVSVPLWEGYDEWAHYRYVQYVAAQRALPPPGLEIVTVPGMPDELLQPPLYYVLGALVAGALGGDAAPQIVLNPHAFTGTGEGGVNVAVHDPREEGFPYHGTARAVHAIRLLSVLIGTLAVVATYLTGRCVFPRQPELALAGAAFAAFAPQFLFMGAIVNNDVAAVTVAALILLFAVRLAAPEGRVTDALVLCVCMATGFVTKPTVLASAPVALLALAIAGGRRAGVRGVVPIVAAVLSGCALLAAALWLAARAPQAGADATLGFLAPLVDHLRAIGTSLSHLERMPWQLPVEAWRYGFQTFWASFGWGNVAAAPWLYPAFAALCVVAAAGVVRAFAGGVALSTRVPLAMLALQCVSAVLVVAYREALMERVLLKGRYVLVALPAISLLIVIGIAMWVPPRRRSAVLVALCAALFAVAVATPFVSILPVYARPPGLSAEEIAAIPSPLDVALSEQAELLGYDVGTGRVRAGQAIAVTLYWRALGEMEDDATVGVAISGADYAAYGETHAYPGRGNFATTLWRPGDTFSDTYWVPVSADAPAPCLGRIRVSLFEWRPAPTDGSAGGSAGAPLGSAVFGRIAIRPVHRLQPDIPVRTDARLGDVALLRGWGRASGDGTRGADQLTLYWQALETPDADYTVFVHLLDASGVQIAGSDSEPRGGLYPTSLWEPGDVVIDVHTHGVADAGCVRYAVGLYDPATQVRVPAYDRAGVRLPDDTVYLDVEP